MSMWLYQCSQSFWAPAEYRLDIWEGAHQRWPVGQKVPADKEPEPGDIMAIMYAKSGGTDPGFYGWAVILRWDGGNASDRSIIFRPTAPSDYLKMSPWWDDEAEKLADEIRGKVKQGTFWHVPDGLALKVREGIRRWTGGR